MKSSSPANVTAQAKPPFYFPSPNHLTKSPLEFSKSNKITLSPYYSNSNTKNTSKEKIERSQNSLKETEEVIQNLEEKLNKNLKENYDLHQVLNVKVKQIEEERKMNFAFKSKIKELEGLLSLYSKEKGTFEITIKEKDEEIDDLKDRILVIKEKYMKATYIELQLENYKEMIEELQNLLLEKNRENTFLKEKKSEIVLMPEKIKRIFCAFNEIDINFKCVEIKNFENFYGVLEENLTKIKDKIKLSKGEIEKLNSRNKELNEQITNLTRNRNIETNKNLQENQLKQLREIDKKNKEEIERLFHLLNSRKIESERLNEENKAVILENKHIKEKYLVSLQKIKNFEISFSQNFQKF